MEKIIGTLAYLKGTFADGTVVYWNKTQEYVKDPAHATFCKNKKQAEKNKKAWEDWWNTAKALTENNHIDKPSLKFEEVNPWIDWEVKCANITEAK